MVVLIAPVRSWFRRWGSRLGIAIVAALAVGVAGEALLRAGAGGVRALIDTQSPGARSVQALIRTQTRLNEMIYAQDPELGALLAPSRQDLVETVDFTYTLQTDSAGFPNPEPWPDRVDVAVLGNSLLIGPGVGMEGQFTSLLERRLDGATVLNLGLPGGGTDHELLTYRRFVEPLRPKLVIATLWVVWDIDNSMQFASWLRERKPDPDYTHYRYTYSETHRSTASETSRSAAPPSGLERMTRFLRRQLGRSVLVRVIYRGLESFLGDPGMTVLVRFPNGDDILLSARTQQRLAKGMDRTGAPDLRDIFFRPLEQLRTEVEQGGSRFVILLVPSKEELYGARVSPEILRSIEEVKAGLESRRLPILDLYPVFRELGQEHPPFYHADMHLNDVGNQIVTDAIVNWIREEQVFTATKASAAENSSR